MSNILDSFFETLKQKGVSVAAFSKESGIPVDRIYMWKKGKGKPKAEDSKIITEWLGKVTGGKLKSPTENLKEIVQELLKADAA